MSFLPSRRFAAAVFLLVSLLLMGSSSSNSPFIYYYSVAKAAFIVERADGSDSRVLATYPLPKDQTDIHGAGWSPSGKWFAWTSNYPAGNGGLRNAYIAKREGGTPHKVFPRDLYVEEMLWSPSTDLLLILYWDGVSTSGLEKALVYEADTNTVLITINAGNIAGVTTEAWFHREIWSPDGNRIALAVGSRLAIVEPRKHTYRIIMLGNVPFENQETCSDFGAMPRWFKDGRIAYLRPRQPALVIENPDTLKQTFLQIPEGTLGLIDWSPDESYALILAQPDDKVFKFGLWLLSVANQSLQQISDDVSFNYQCLDIGEAISWNNKGEAAFASGAGQLEILSTSPIHVTQVSMPSKGEVAYLRPMLWQPNDDLMFMWYGPLYGSRLYTHSSQTNEVKVRLPLDHADFLSSEWDDFKPFGDDLLAYTDEGRAFVANLKLGTQVGITFQAPPEYGEGGVASTMWNAGGSWLFLLSDNIENQHLVNIASADGKLQRRLTQCNLNTTCFGFLPDDKP